MDLIIICYIRMPSSRLRDDSDSRFQFWKVFKEVETFIVLVPALLGLKGNLEMTMAARMSTEMNTGSMDTLKEQWVLVSGNLALTQV